jgi:hypothetical protein
MEGLGKTGVQHIRGGKNEDEDEGFECGKCLKVRVSFDGENTSKIRN